MSTIENNIKIILEYLYEHSNQFVDAQEIKESTKLSIEQINDACNILSSYGYVELFIPTSTNLFDFKNAQITPHGKLEFERAKENKAIKNGSFNLFKILGNIITIAGEVFILALSILWYITTKDYEPIIVFIATIISLGASIFSKIKIK